jgi:hypothetical protein
MDKVVGAPFTVHSDMTLPLTADRVHDQLRHQKSALEPLVKTQLIIVQDKRKRERISMKQDLMAAPLHFRPGSLTAVPIDGSSSVTTLCRGSGVHPPANRVQSDFFAVRGSSRTEKSAWIRKAAHLLR